MTLSEHIIEMLKLESQGHGDKKMFTVHGASGECCEMHSAHISDEVGYSGPFDLEDGEEYISVYVGN